jgi:hypothetical protein
MAFLPSDDFNSRLLGNPEAEALRVDNLLEPFATDSSSKLTVVLISFSISGDIENHVVIKECLMSAIDFVLQLRFAVYSSDIHLEE